MEIIFWNTIVSLSLVKIMLKIQSIIYIWTELLVLRRSNKDSDNNSNNQLKLNGAIGKYSSNRQCLSVSSPLFSFYNYYFFFSIFNLKIMQTLLIL